MGLSNRDIDNQLKYDDRTGEVYFGGKSLGKTQANVDGISYYDSDTLNSAFNDYVNRAGITAPKEQLAQQLWQNLVGNYKDYYDNMVKENPYTNEVGKSILSKYDLAGYTAGNNAAASGAASNGGNIDSFAAGNAMRNQAALIAMGQEKALAAQNQKLERARDILANMGVDAEKIFNASETEKNNDVTRNATIADVTGYTPEQWTYANNPYLNDDGTLVRESDNFKEFMDTAREKLKDTTLSADERKKWQDQYNYAAQSAENKAQREHDQKLLETQLGIDSNTGTADVKVSDFVNTINTIYGKDTISTNDKGKYVVNDNYKYKVLVAIQNMKNVSDDTKNGLRDALDI